jgi:hexosaminidase
MKKTLILIVMIFPVMILVPSSCTKSTPSDLTKESIIPKPVSLSATGDYFRLKDNSNIYVYGESEDMKRTGEYLAGIIRELTGYTPEIKTASGDPWSGNIFLSLENLDEKFGEEGYELTVTKKLVKIIATKPAGIVRGIQTVRQILKVNDEKSWQIATGSITDYPEYSFRGSMLDVSRHFFSVEDVKKYIDYLAFYKMNVLHLHLSDDQGWRIEIKSWPNLAQHGGSTQVGGAGGGFYTQEQYTDIVNYAGERYITIIPEIDMPGHTNAALASYAELNCDGKARELYTGTEVGFSTLCTGKDITYKFIDDVVKELAGLTPGPYIHIGGDESHATKIEDYIPFVNKVGDIVVRHGKQVIGWDEIANATLKPGSVAQHWASIPNAKKAMEQGAKLLMSPANKAYLDMQYDSTSLFGLHWAAYIEVDSAYMWDPADLVPGLEKNNIIGIEAPLWSETISNLDEIEYLLFPRLPGYAEIGWTPAPARNWDEYKLRLADHARHFKAMEINYYASKKVPWPEVE